MNASSARTTFWTYIALGAFITELMLYTVLRNKWGQLQSSVLFLAASCLLGVATWQVLRDQPFRAVAVPRSGRNNWRAAVFYSVVLVFGALQLVPRLRAVFDSFPFDLNSSDIIPTIQIHVRRLLEGEVVYKDITEFSYPLAAAYLPTMWLPYTIADTLNQDYRWTAATVLLLGLLAYTWRLGRLQPSFYEGMFKLSLPFLIFGSVLVLDPPVLGRTLEMTVAGYYLLLMASLFSRSLSWRAVALVLCLLSRFSVLFWVPFYLLLVWRNEGRRAALLLTGLVALGILLVYVLPFMSHDWLYIFNAMSNYTGAALGEWQGNLNPVGQPNHLYQGLGLAAYFYEYVPGETIDKIHAVQRVGLLASILTIVAATVVYLRSKSRLDYRYVALIVLKVYLAVFYAFIQVPYSYLMIVVVFSSLWLVLCLPELTERGQTERQPVY